MPTCNVQGFIEATSILIGTTNGLLFGITAATLYKACKGTRYWAVMIVDGLLLGASVGYLVNAVCFHKVYGTDAEHEYAWS
jgi:hypothetical protein